MMEPVAYLIEWGEDLKRVQLNDELELWLEYQEPTVSPLITLSQAQSLLAEARDKALEEAARVADNFEDYYGQARDNHESGSPDFYRNNASAYAAMDIAAVTRALKEKP